MSYPNSIGIHLQVAVSMDKEEIGWFSALQPDRCGARKVECLRVVPVDVGLQPKIVVQRDH